jgi:hypothetical protein
MLHTKYQSSMPCRFWKEEFLRFSYITDEPTNGTPFDPKGMIWTIFVEDFIMLHTKYQGSTNCGFDKRFFKYLNNYNKALCKEYACQVELNLAKRY